MAGIARLGSYIAGAVLALQAMGCVSRTLPLPPPDIDPLVAANAQGLVLVKGTCQEGASVGVLDDTTMAGVIVTSPNKGCDRSCPFQTNIAAKSGDVLRIWQFFETPTSVDLKVPK